MVAAAYEGPQICMGFEADGDLSSSQYHFVKLSGDSKVAIASSADDVCIGVLQNKPTTGLTADVCICGITKINSAAGLTYANLINADADGHAAAVSVGNVANGAVGGIVIGGTGEAGDLGTAFVCFSPVLSA